MSALTLIWMTSLVLAAMAILVMLLLVVSRLTANRNARRRAAERSRVMPMLLGGSVIEQTVLRDAAPDVVTDLSLELIQLVRGDERAAFIDSAVRLGVPHRLAERLGSWSQRRRAVAVQGLAQFDDPETRAALHGALDDPDKDVRLAAALALAGTGDTLDAGELVDKLGLGTDQSSLFAVDLFRRIAETQPDQIRALVVRPGQHADVRIAAIEALAKTGDYSLVPVLAELGLAAPDDTEELPRYLHALGKLGHPAARAAVLAGLSRNSMAARAAAAGAAGQIRLVEAAGRLAELLDDPEWWVRFRAAEALIELDEPGLALLRAAARGPRGRARAAATTMLAERRLGP